MFVFTSAVSGQRNVRAAIDRATTSLSWARTVLVWTALTLVLSVLRAPAAEPAMIDAGLYADPAAAQKVWQPMRGSAPVEVALIDGRNVLRLPCRFAGSKAERASWDRSVSLDLSSGRGIEFKVLCTNTTPVSHFSFYFQSGEGWYYASFFPESQSGWNTIHIDKSEMQPEGRPAGWHRIQAIRISAWRGNDVDTEFYFKDLRPTGVLGADASIALVRADSVRQAQPEEGRNLDRYEGTITEMFRALNTECASLSDLDITSARLQAARLVILPYNPSLPERAAAELTHYLQNGGKLLIFYGLPEKLRATLKLQSVEHVKAPRSGAFSALRFTEGALPGVPARVGQQSWNISLVKPLPGTSRILAEWLDDQGQPTGYPALVAGTNWMVMTHVLLPDDPQNKRRLLLAMAGTLVPELWSQAARASLDQIGRVASYQRYDEAADQIRRLGQSKPAVEKALASAQASRESALRLISEGQFARAIDEAETAGQQLEQGFCLAQSPVPGEFRAFWCHSAFGVKGLDWDEAIRRLATNGINAVLPNMLWGGAAFYPSKTLPVVPQVAERGDQIAQCLAACRKYGVQIHVWKVNWNLGSAAPKPFVEQMRLAKRLQADTRGKEEPWLCPLSPGQPAARDRFDGRDRPQLRGGWHPFRLHPLPRCRTLLLRRLSRPFSAGHQALCTPLARRCARRGSLTPTLPRVAPQPGDGCGQSCQPTGPCRPAQD